MRNIRDLLKAGRVLFHEGSAVIDAPFFTTQETNVDYMDVDENTEIKNNVLSCVNSSLLGPELYDIYSIIKNPDHGFNIGSMVFLSPKEIAERQNIFSPKMIDIGLMYMGMGYACVLSYVPKNGTFVVRLDGGSNGYDREDFYKTYKSDEYDPTQFPYNFKNDTSENDETRPFVCDSPFRKNTQYTYSELMEILNKSFE